MNVWLAEYKKTQNIAVMVEMVEVLQKLPVTVHALKKVTNVYVYALRVYTYICTYVHA